MSDSKEHQRAFAIASTELDLDSDVHYPTSDGLALLGTSWHEAAVYLAREALGRHFRGRNDLFLGTLMALYYERSLPARRLIPDLFVAFGVHRSGRASYKLWVERQVPQFVLEVASRSTRDRDSGFKKDEYERIGVKEYWQLDQTAGLLDRPLIGWRLRRGLYARVTPCDTRDGEFEYPSEELGLLLRKRAHRDGLTVAFHDPRRGRDVLTGGDLDRALSAQSKRADAAEKRALEAEAKVRRYRDKVRRYRDRERRYRDLVAELTARVRGQEPTP